MVAAFLLMLQFKLTLRASGPGACSPVGAGAGALISRQLPKQNLNMIHSSILHKWLFSYTSTTIRSLLFILVTVLLRFLSSGSRNDGLMDR